MSSPLTQSPHPRLSAFASLTALATLGLLAAGGLVTSHGAGMAVPDWPNTYGYNLFFFPFSQWVGGVFYEHTHRLLGALVGLLTSVLALWLWGASARLWMRRLGLVLLAAALGALLAWPRRWSDALVLGLAGAALFASSFAWPRCGPSAPWLRRLGLAAFVGVVLQGVLGGLRVVLFQDQLGIFHATLAQVFFVLVCALALFTSRWWQNAASIPVSHEARRLPFLVTATTLLILAQLILGACMRHQHAGLAIPDFPLAYGKLWPPMDAASVALANQRRLETVALNPITSFQIGLQMAHRIVAALIVAAVGVCAWQTWRRLGPRSTLGRLALVWLGLVLAQALLGAMTIWSDKAADIATAHLLGGALLLALGTFQCLLWFRQLLPTHSNVAPAPDGGECRVSSVEGRRLAPSTLGPRPSALSRSLERTTR